MDFISILSIFVLACFVGYRVGSLPMSTLDSRALRAAGSLAVALALPTAAHAQSRWLSTIWIIEPTNTIPEERDYAGGDYLLKQRLLPSGLVAITQGFSDARLKVSVDPGAQFFEVKVDRAAVYCHMRRTGKKANSEAYLCLMDADHDGRFEAAFKGLSETAGIPTIVGKLPKSPLSIPPLSYAAIDPAAFSEKYFVGIQRRNFFNIYGRESFMILFGTDAYAQEITAPAQFKAADLPKEVTILGARFTAISETDGKMRIKVHSSMPLQPFGVVRSVTYR